jgi:signal peptidase I
VIIPIVLAVCLIVGLFFGLRLSVRVVESGSMCIPYGGGCDGWLSLTHTFNGSLHKGDIIIVQYVNTKELNTNYPNSDIIVYKKPTAPEETPIVHRIVTSYEENGTIYFQTKGDGNSPVWPANVTSDQYDTFTIWGGNDQGVSEDLVEGKVVLRIPYLGWIPLISQGIFSEYPWALSLAVLLIVLLVVVEFVRPSIKRKKNPVLKD